MPHKQGTKKYKRRSRGRKAKTVEAKKEGTAEVTADKDNNENNANSANVSEKRKRGRPRKSVRPRRRLNHLITD